MEKTITIVEGTAVVDTYPGHEPGIAKIVPRVKLGESVARELESLLGHKARVNYDPSATFVFIEVENVHLREKLGQVVEFLGSHPTRWWFPIPIS